MEYIPYVMELGKILGWPAVVIATVLAFVIRDLSKRVAKVETANPAITAAFKEELTKIFNDLSKRIEKLEAANTSIKDAFKDELDKIYNKINAIGTDVAVLKDRSDRKENTED